MSHLITGPMGQFSLQHRNNLPVMPEWRDNHQDKDPPTSTNAPSGIISPPEPEVERPKPEWSKSNNWRCLSTPVVESFEKDSFKDLKIGQILHLTDQRVPEDSIFYKHKAAADGNPFGHPVVVCKKWERNGVEYVDIRLCTSFGGNTLENSRKTFDWRYYLLVDNHCSTVLPLNNTRLATMVNGGKFRGRTYVNLSPNGLMPLEYKYLSAWGNNSLRFDKESAERIANATSLFHFSGPLAIFPASPR